MPGTTALPLSETWVVQASHKVSQRTMDLIEGVCWPPDATSVLRAGSGDAEALGLAVQISGEIDRRL